jgi:ABC-type lipoprotein release transport system permease subunit
MFSPLNIRVGLYLALRSIRRSSLWTTGLIVFVMLLTFLNLVVVTGILVGLIDGINGSYRDQYIGDVIVSSLSTKKYIENSPSVISFIQSLPQVESMTARYVGSGTVDANYKTRTDPTDTSNQTGAQISGINPVAEEEFSHFSQYVVEGSYLEPGDFDQVLVGSQLLAEYSFGDQPGFTTLKGIKIGSKLRLTIGDAEREVTVKGIIKSKIGELSLRVFMTDTQFRALAGRTDNNVAEIAVKLKPGSSPEAFRDLLLKSGIGNSGKVLTFLQSIPQGVADIKSTFAMLGNMISSVGLVVASITIFIVIFINALTRRKFIGILKGIGIDGRAIEFSYILQSLFYAVLGSGVGLLVLYGFLVPFVASHPIDFPFSDGILVAPIQDTLVRIALLVAATIIAGYIPARMIVKKNTLDSILGRN